MEKNHPIRWLMWALAALFFFYEFIIRVAPSVMTDQLMRAFGIYASGVGNLTAFYLYAYSPMQIPVGTLADHYGARKLLSFAALVCAIGCAIFSFATSFGLAATGRFLMGFGSAFGFVGLVYISTHWFEKSKHAFLIGLGNSIGMFGAIVGEGPTSLLTQEIGWRSTFLIYALFAILLAIIIYCLVRNSPEHTKMEGSAQGLFFHIKNVCKTPHSWLNAISCFLFYATTVAFAGLWGPSFLTYAQGLSPHLAGFAISMIFVGWIVGGPILGKYSDKIGKRKPFLLLFPLLAFLAVLPIIYLKITSVFLIYTILFLVGLFSSAQILHFTVAVESNPSESKGTAIAFTNFMTMIGGAILQPFIGWLLGIHWDGQVVAGVPIYSDYEWKFAMTIFPLCFLLSFILNFFIKEERSEKNPDISF